MNKSLGPSLKDFPISYAVVGIVVLAAVLKNFPSTGSAVALCSAITFVTLTILIIFRWTHRISETNASYESKWLVGAGIFCALFAPANVQNFSAVVLGVASVYFLFAGRFAWRRHHPNLQWLINTVGCSFIAGVYADSYNAGWHTLTYTCFGASAFLALSAAVNSEGGKTETISLSE